MDVANGRETTAPELQDTKARKEEAETEMASSLLAEAQVLAIRWMEKSSETKNAATQTSPPRRNRIKTEFHEVGVQTDQSMCHIRWWQSSAGARFVLRMQGMELDQGENAGAYVSDNRGGSNGVNKTSRPLGDDDQRQPDDHLPGSSAHMRNGMPLNTTQKLSHGPPLVAYHEQGREDMLAILRRSNNDNKDEFESGFRPQHPLGGTEYSFRAHQKSTAMPILGSHPTLAIPPSPDEMQGQRSKNGQRGLDSPKDESIVEMLDCDQCEPGEDVVMGTPSSAEETQGRGSDSPKGESNVEGLDCDQCNPGEDVVMGTPSSPEEIQGQRPKNGERGLDSPKGESNVEGLDCDQCEPGEDVAMDDDNRERQTAVNHSDDESVCIYQSLVVDMTPKRPIDEEIGVESSQRDWKIGGCAAAPDYITAYADADVPDSITAHADADVPDSITDHADAEVPRLWSRPPLRIKMMDQSSSKLILAEDIVMDASLRLTNLPAEFQLCKRPRMNDSLERPVGAKRTRYGWAGQLALYPFPEWDLGESSQMLRQKYEGLFHSFICKPPNDFNCQSMRLNDAVWWREAEKVAMVESTARESSIPRATQRVPELILVEEAQVNRPEEPQARRIRAGPKSTPMTIRRGDRCKMPSPYIAALLSGEYVTSNLPRDPRTPIRSGWAWPDNAETNGKPRPSGQSMITKEGTTGRVRIHKNQKLGNSTGGQKTAFKLLHFEPRDLAL
ncbi:hypothetical protein B0H14DRAFT_3769134 [Mycena olivaceomarginata]|nr:hypothetical protein B0H14DRAFT_3769134 [Mycena olivaceomarginata]